MRMLRWGARGACEEVLVLGVGGLGLILAMIVVVLVLTSLVLRGVLPRVEDARVRRQTKVLEGVSVLSPPDQTIPRNSAALRLEAAAADLGVALAPLQSPHRARPSSEAAAALAQVAGAFVDPRRPSPWPEAARYVAWHTTTNRQVDALVATSLQGEPPQWRIDADRPCQPDLELGGMLLLQHVLLSEAWIAIVEHRSDAASRLLHASWRVNESLLQSPELAVHDTAIAALEDLLAMLRLAPGRTLLSERRLASVDPMASTRGAYLFEARRARRRAQNMLWGQQRQVRFMVRPFGMLAAMPQETLLVEAVTRLDPARVTHFDADVFAADLDRRMPRWNALARRAMPSSWQSWPRSVHAALALDLTKHTLEVRRRVREGGGSLDRLPVAWPDPVTGGRWVCRRAGRQVVIALEPNPFSEGGWPALRQSVAVARDDADGA